jgi:amidase
LADKPESRTRSLEYRPAIATKGSTLADKPESRTVPRIPENLIYAFSPKNPPCDEIVPGETVIVETSDCFSGQIEGPEDLFEKVGWDRINPATGPISIQGAEVGDTLAVDILDVRVLSPGVMIAVPDMGAAGHRLRESKSTLIPIVNGLAHLPGDVMLECRPMIGVIGTSPKEGEIPTGTPGPHGGNMDSKVIAEGSTVYLPVNVPGAMLALGDLHALMGDGEVLICGVEAAGTVKLRTRLIKGLSLPCPIVETKDALYAIWSEETLDLAAESVVDKSVSILAETLGIEDGEALCLLSAAGNLQISQIVDPLKTVRMEIPKSLLKGRYPWPA